MGGKPGLVCGIDKQFEARSGLAQLPSVKNLRIRYKLDKKYSQHIDSWIDFAIANRVDTLHLELFPAFSKKYKLSKKSWSRNPLGPCHLRSLKSLSLSCVVANNRFIKFILSSCPLLEDLSLHFIGSCNHLDISGMPLPRLRRLKLDIDREFELTKLCAPNLTSFYCKSSIFRPHEIDVPMLTDLTIGGPHRYLKTRSIKKYLNYFWGYLPQLEKLELIMDKHQSFRFQQMPKLDKLKYLKIDVNWDTDPVFYRILEFINVCPLLETFVLEVHLGDNIPGPLSKYKVHADEQAWLSNVNEMPSFKSLKVLELSGGDDKLIDQVVVKYIIQMSPILEKLTVDTRHPWFRSRFWTHRPKLVRM